MDAINRLIEREHELDRYRSAVEHSLGACLALARREDLDRFFAHVERCFDWGVKPPSCGRTWMAKADPTNETEILRLHRMKAVATEQSDVSFA